MVMSLSYVGVVVSLRCDCLQWHRTATTQETDGFQVKRPGDQNVKCTVLLMLDHQVSGWQHCTAAIIMTPLECESMCGVNRDRNTLNVYLI